MVKTLQIGLEWFPERGGGLDRVYYDCTRYLPQVGVEIDGLVAGSPNVAKSSNGEVLAFAPPDISLWKRWIRLRQSFSQLSKRNHYPLIVSHFALYLFPLLDLLGKRPLVTHFQGPWALECQLEGSNSAIIWIKKALEKAAYRRSTSFIVLCQDFKDILHNEYDVPLEKINIVPPGVDIDRFNISLAQNEARQKLKWDLNRPTIFCIRRLAKRMGLENLVAAMAQVTAVYPDVILYIAGKGNLATKLQAQINELGLTDNIKLLGFVADEDLPLYYRGADFSVVPTVALEGFGLIVIESLAAGTPVIGTPVGGIPETLKPLSPDLVLEDSSSEQLAQGIMEALSGSKKLPSSEDCLDYVKANYDWHGISQKINQVYLDALV